MNSPENAKQTTFTYQGWSGIFALPYRIQAKEEMLGFETNGGKVLYRIYPPFLRRPKGGPITDDVPPHLWPNFQWHPETPTGKREPHIPPLTLRYEEALFYDGLRVDLVQSEKSDRVLQFVQSSMRWLRLFSGQPWIGDIDRHVEPTLKRIFMIDPNGLAKSEIHPSSQMSAITTLRLVTNEMWKGAFEAAAGNQEVPVYWNLFFDGMNAVPERDFSRCVMNFAMALESCRDQSFSKVHPSKFIQGRGPKLMPPFDHTDLLKHLTTNAHDTFGRDFSIEMPQHWEHLRNLYIARHHVAHGSAAAYRGAAGIQALDELETYDDWRSAVRAAILWMETLSGSVAHRLVPVEEEHTVRISMMVE